MKKNILILTVAMLFLNCFTQCKKNEDEALLHNIILYNQPLKTIQRYIQGKWKVVYVKGGISSTYKQYCNDCSVEFTATNEIISNSFAITDGAAAIQWTRDIGTYTNGGYTYLMTFSDQQSVPWAYVVDRIYCDTLIYHDNSMDAVFYYCVRTK